jgi:inosine/xanthosine triphosphate pyrophosphatase family protein
MAEVEPEVKNRISHRARALEKLKQVLSKFLNELR